VTGRQWRDRVRLRKMTIDTLKVAKRLREAGFSEPQAEAVVAAVQEGTAGADLATKADLAELRSELKAEIREVELRLEAKIEAVRSDIMAVKADILNRVFGMILGTLVVNIVAIVGAMFAVAKLVAH
jgi:DNA-binding transcriptional MerR regulator